MIACRTGKWYYDKNNKDNNQKYYSPLFRIKKTSQTSETRYTTSFLNFTVWWECLNDYTKKTYTVNTCLRGVDTTSGDTNTEATNIDETDTEENTEENTKIVLVEDKAIEEADNYFKKNHIIIKMCIFITVFNFITMQIFISQI